jgi:hypothetical protein
VTAGKDLSSTENGEEKGGKLLTLVSLDIPAVPLRDPRARKIAAEHDHLGDEIVFDAVVEDLL